MLNPDTVFPKGQNVAFESWIDRNYIKRDGSSLVVELRGTRSARMMLASREKHPRTMESEEARDV